MKIVHVVECFAGGVFSFLSNLTNELDKEEYIVIYGINRDNTPSDFREKFPPNTKFIPWKSASRSLNPLTDLKALWELYIILKKIDDIFVEIIELQKESEQYKYILDEEREQKRKDALHFEILESEEFIQSKYIKGKS